MRKSGADILIWNPIVYQTLEKKQNLCKIAGVFYWEIIDCSIA